MEYRIGRLNLKKGQDDVIRKESKTRIKEDLFKAIAKEVLPSEGFTNVESPSCSQSVPFDFIATLGNKLALIEMKGADKDFNYSKDTQFARLLRVVEKLQKNNTDPGLFLLQLNLRYGVYQILPEEFYNMIFPGVKRLMKKSPELGMHQDVKTCLKAIEDYRLKYGV